MVDDPILKKGFVQVPVGIVKHPDISQGAKLTYSMLLWYAWKAGEYPGHEEMAADLGVSTNSVWRYLKDLQKASLILVHRPGLGKTNEYRLLRLQESDDSDLSDLKGQTFDSSKDKPLESQRVKDNKSFNNKDEDESLSFSSRSIQNDKTALLESLATEFAPDEQPQAIVTYLGRFPEDLLNRAAEITRQSANAKRPVAFLYGTVQRLAEQEALAPLSQQRTETLPELTEEEYQASLQALDRVKGQLG